MTHHLTTLCAVFVCVFAARCFLRVQSCSYLCERVATRHEIPLQAGSTIVALFVCAAGWGYVQGAK